MFAFRCEMNNLRNNFGKVEMCEFSCKETMNNKHLLSCVYMNQGEPHKLEIEQLRNGNLNEKTEVLKILIENSERRLKHIESRTN